MPRLFRVIIFIIIIIILSSPTYASELEIVLKVGDTLALTGVNTGLLSVYIDNYNLEVFGFQFVLKSERPDLVWFDFTNGGFDSTGTLVSGFEYMYAYDRANNGSECWFQCIAEIDYSAPVHTGILPQLGGVAIKIPYQTTATPDTLQPLSSIISIERPTDFSDELANSIGAISDTLVDTTFYKCLSWQSDTCTKWIIQEDPLQGYDSLKFDSTLVGLLDTNIVKVYPGSITISIMNCDSDGNGQRDIDDIVCMIEQMFGTDPNAICYFPPCDADNSSRNDIDDLVYLINYMFGDGPPP